MKGKWALISYYEKNVIKQLYVPYDENCLGGETNMKFEQPLGIPVLVGEREFKEKVHIKEE